MLNPPSDIKFRNSDVTTIHRYIFLCKEEFLNEGKKIMTNSQFEKLENLIKELSVPPPRRHGKIMITKSGRVPHILNNNTRVIDNYDISFEAILSIPETKKLLMEFLKSSHNDELLLFLDAVEEYQKENDSEIRFLKANQIVSQFIECGSRYEINISHEDRIHFLKKFSNCSKKNCPVDLFQDLKRSSMLLLKTTGFILFTHSKNFLEFCKTCDLELFNKFAQMK